MATYLYICEDGHRFDGAHGLTLCFCGVRARRDYRGEGVSFGVVPGGFKDTNSTTMFDRDSLIDQGISLSRDEVEDRRSDGMKAINEFVRDSEG